MFIVNIFVLHSFLHSLNGNIDFLSYYGRPFPRNLHGYGTAIFHLRHYSGYVYAVEKSKISLYTSEELPTAVAVLMVGLTTDQLKRFMEFTRVIQALRRVDRTVLHSTRVVLAATAMHPEYGVLTASENSDGDRINHEMLIRRMFLQSYLNLEPRSRKRPIIHGHYHREAKIARILLTFGGTSNSSGANHKGDGPRGNRSRREARNHQHQRPTNQPRADPNDQTRRQPGAQPQQGETPAPVQQSRMARMMDDMTEEIKMGDISERHADVVRKNTPWTYVFTRRAVAKYGRLIYLPEQKQFLVADGDVAVMHGKHLHYCQVLPDGNHNVSLNEPGRFKEGQCNQQVDGPISFEQAPDIVALNILGQEYVVARALYKLFPHVCTFNPNHPVTTEHAWQVINSRIGNVPYDLFMSSWEYYKHMCYASANGVMNDRPGRHFALTGGIMLQRLYNAAGEPGVVVMNAVDCPLPLDWPVKEIARITVDGVRVTPAEFFALAQHCSRRDDYSDSAYRRTIAYRLKGPNDFLIPETSSYNMVHAMKRVIGARENEAVLYANQLAILRDWQNSDPLHDALRDVFGNLKARCSELKVRFYSEELNLMRLGVVGHLATWVDACESAIRLAADDIVAFEPFSCVKLKDVTKYYDFIAAGATEVFSWESRRLASDIAHVKQKLRKAQVERSWGKSVLTHFVKRIELKVKKEFAKPGKAPRAYADYADGAIWCGELPELVKIAIHGAQLYQIGHIRLEIFLDAKPGYEALQYIFTRAREATTIDNYVFVAIYSDDSLYAGNVGGKAFAANIDISSCDTSNNELVFTITQDLMSTFHEDKAVNLVEMCRLPIRTTLKTDDGPKRVEVNLPHPFEGSGTVLTTILNFVASVCIAVSAVGLMGELDIEDSIKAGAARIGHMVSYEDCAHDGAVVFEKLQFLKHSVARSTNGAWVVYQNFGTILRSFGSIECDLTHIELGLSPSESRSLGCRGRWQRFLASVLKAYCNEPSSPILDALRAKFLSAPIHTNLEEAHVYHRAIDGLKPYEQRNRVMEDSMDRSEHILDINSLSMRYPGLATSNIAEIIQRSELFSVVQHDIIGTVMYVDYSLPVA